MNNDFEYKSKRIQYKGYQIQTYSFGEGSHTIFSFPSFPHSGLYYLFFTKFYNHKNYRFVTFDLPGWTGWSENIFADEEEKVTLEKYLDIARHVLNEYEIKEYSLIGYSFGAALAFMLAASNPTIVKRLVLVSPVIFGELTHTSKQWRLLKLTKRLNAHKIMKRSFNQHTRNLMPFFRKYVNQELLDMYMSMFAHADSRVMLESIWTLFNINNENLIKDVSEIQKILIVNSIDEPRLFRAQAEHLRRKLPEKYTLKMHGTHDDFILRPTSKIVDGVMDFLTERTSTLKD